MANTVSVEQSRAIPVNPEDAFAAALAIPLPTLLDRARQALESLSDYLLR
jgi:hypothetical protein